MLRAILLEPEFQGNVGAVARLVENFGIDELVLVRPRCELGEEARRFASHATGTLEGARVLDDLDPVVNDLDVLAGTTGIKAEPENVLRHGTDPRTFAAGRDHDARTGVLLGREGTGLSNAELDRCDVTLSIPTSDDYPVMNLSHAAAVIFHELHATPGRDTDEGASSREKRAVLENLFKSIAGRLGWDETRQERAVRAARNVLGRAYVTDRELQHLLGLFNDVDDRMGDD